jgi:equilibrative nucleoside transporter 1/2/3
MPPNHFLLFTLFGIALLTPWNVWIQVHELLNIKLANTPFINDFEGFITLTYQLGNFITLLSLILIRSKIEFPTTSRLVLGLWLLIMVFLSAILIIFLEMNYILFFAAILFLVLLSSISGAFLSSFIGLASAYPSSSITYLTVGQGIAALLPSISQFISPWGAETNVTICFIQSIVIGLLSLFAYNQMLNEEPSNYEVVAESELDTFGDNESESSLLDIFKDIHPAALSVFLNLFITLSIFPTITSTVEDSQYDRLPLLHFVVYNSFDLIGKYATIFRILNQPSVVKLTFIRVFFIPLILMCHVSLKFSAGLLPRVFNTKLYLLILSLFGFSNGFLTSNSFINSGTLLRTPNPKNFALSGDVMQISLSLGLILGSICTFLIQKIAL